MKKNQFLLTTFVITLIFSVSSCKNEDVKPATQPKTVTSFANSIVNIGPKTLSTPIYPGDPFFFSHDGLFYRNSNTGQIYIIFEGYYRYIPTAATLNGLFTHQSSYGNIFTGPGNPFGNAFTSDNGFIRDTQTMKCYLREGTLLRWIVSPQVQHQYSFNFSILQDVNGLAGYTVGADITQ